MNPLAVCITIVGQALSLIQGSEFRESFDDDALTYWVEEAGDVSDKLTFCARYYTIDPALVVKIDGIGHEYVRRLHIMQESLQRNLDGFNALARCRSVPDFMAVQSDLIRMNLEQTVQGTRRVAEVTTRMADEGDQTVKALTKKVRRAA